MNLHVHGIARLVADPEVKYLPDATPVAGVRLVFDRPKKKENGEKGYEPLWVTVTLFGENQQGIVPFLKKGEQVAVEEGVLEMRSWQKDDGTTGTSLEIKYARLTLIGNRADREDGSGNGHTPSGTPASNRMNSAPRARVSVPPVDDGLDEPDPFADGN